MNKGVVYKKFKYSDEQLQLALVAVKRGMSIRKAGLEYDIPFTTLRDKIRMKYTGGARPGKSPVLSYDEELRIAEWVPLMARAGFPVTLKQVRICVAQFLKRIKRDTSFNNGIPGQKWVELFLKRHPELFRRKPSTLARYRATIQEDQIRAWFDEVRSYIRDENLEYLLKCSDRIFNLDETAFELVVRKRKCLSTKDTKHLYSVWGNNDKESYTALFTASASGKLLPPLLLFPYKSRLPGEVIRSAQADWGIGKTDSGWMTGNAFYEFLKNIFQPWLEQENIPLPVLLFVDGHKSHATLLSTEFCKKFNIILVCLFPNSTHLTQPLDVSFFGPLKKRWEDQLLDFRQNTECGQSQEARFVPL
ncbi:uncharacterized protein LOC131687258 [Topomyia yanbarensis]|uniref:uncharacterized protein LOC131687258 n=1 Tax=Topomyia yanbarensis TaxID=2498891 RepID=UPI00273AC845|nr:uncharacterized protein LOC131687258 [Topomyia yanbarensis]